MCPLHLLFANAALTGTSALKKRAIDRKRQALTGSLPGVGIVQGGSADDVSEDLFLSGGGEAFALSVEGLAPR